MFDARQLQVLAEVARSGTYTAAAETLGYTQPAISYQMRMLERAVGSPLVTRRGRGVHLTPVGHALARHADTVLAALRTAEEELTALTSPGAGRVRLAAMQSSCVTLVPAALAALRRNHPELEVTVVQTECPVSHGLVLDGEAELSVMCDVESAGAPGAEDTPQFMLPDPRLRRIPLLTDRRCVLLPAEHPAAAAPAIRLADLAGERWVLESSRARFVAACREAGFTPRVAATADDQLTLHCMVANGIGLAIMNELAVTAHDDPRVVARPLAGWPTRSVYALLWPDTLRSTPVAALVRALHDAARRYGDASDRASGDAPGHCGLAS